MVEICLILGSVILIYCVWGLVHGLFDGWFFKPHFNRQAKEWDAKIAEVDDMIRKVREDEVELLDKLNRLSAEISEVHGTQRREDVRKLA